MSVLTLLMTDLQGSTALWERQPEAMTAALAWHDALVAKVVPAHGGTVVKPRGEGDSIFATFSDATAASACAIDLQLALAGSREATGIPLRVRIAIHTGEVEYRDDDYYGPTVNRCARVRGVAHGGQVVLTAAAAADLDADLPPGAGLIDLGTHQLRDLPDPERLHQLTHPGLPVSFPPLRSTQPGPDNLPGDRGSFVGRDAEAASVTQLLERDRLVTLLGPGGVGKTRLAVQLARSLVGRFPGGRWFVDLTGTGPAQPVAGAIASALGVTGEGRSGLEDAVRSRLRAATTLVVLDNCEHIIDKAAETVDGLLEACPDLHVLATSRERLRVYGEQVWRLAPLSVPQDDPTDLAAARQFPAVELFLDRAAAVAPDVTYGDADAELLAGLCRRLDGLPLGIELAAGRAHTMTLPQIQAGLEDRLRLLSHGPRGRLPRQRSLEALLDWSYDLLDTAAQRVLRRLGILQGGFDLRIAAAVVGLAEDDVEAALDRLVESSLVDRRRGDEVPYRMLETIRHYADARLDDPGERAAARHGAMASLAEIVRAGMRGPLRTPQRYARLKAIAPDLAWVLDRALAEDLEEQALSAAFGLWMVEPDRREAYRAFQRALAVPGGDSFIRGMVLGQAGYAAAELGEIEEAERMVAEALAMARRLDDPVVKVRALNGAAWRPTAAGDAERLRAIGTEQLAAAQRCDGPWHTALAHTNLGIAAEIAEDLDVAYAEHSAALDGYMAAEDPHGIAVCGVNLADIALVRGALGDAAAHLTAAAEIFTALESSAGRFWTAFGLGSVALASGDSEGSARHLLDALALALLRAAPRRAADLLGCVAAHAAVGERWEEAVVLLGAADALGLDPENLAFAGNAPKPPEILESARAALGAEAVATAMSAGGTLTLGQGVARAVAYLEEATATAC